MHIDSGGAVGTRDPDWMNKAAEKLFEETPEGISVDWKDFWKPYHNQEVRTAFTELLFQKGILSSDPDGHFLVMVQPSWRDERSWVVVPPFTRSPAEASYVMFFTKLEYAQEWRDGWPYFQGASSEYKITQLSVHDEGSSPLVPKQDKIEA